jgi:hypothetical protein
VIALMLIALLAQGQTPTRDARPAPETGRGVIAGTVTSDDARPVPLRRARVTLIGQDMAAPRTVITADDGVFRFEDLAAGSYRLAAAKDSFVPVPRGDLRTGSPGVPVQLAAGQQVTIGLRLPRGAVITGTITDVDGLPAPGVAVTALAPRLIGVAGERRLVGAPNIPASITDDRGVYRIYGLPAGDYVVSVQPQQRGPALGISNLRTVSQGVMSPKPLSMTSVYYPGVVDVSQATWVTAQAGAERSGIDVQIQYVPLATVSGIVPVAAGHSPPIVSMVRLGELVGNDPTRVNRAEPDGRFTLPSVAPGRYMLIARSFAPSPLTTSGSPLIVPSVPTQWSTAEIVVEGEDIVNVALTPQTPLTIAGRVVFEGSRPAPDLSGLRLPSLSAGQSIGNFQVPLPQIQLEPEGRFSIAGIMPGVYRLGALSSQATPGIRASIGPWWLKSVVVHGADILDAPLELRRGADDAVVTFSDQSSDLSGVVRDAQGRPATDAIVVAFSTNRSSWFFNSRRVAGVRTDREGRYTVRNLPPGDYRLVATRDLEPNEWFDPAVLDRLLPGGTALRISGPDKLTIDLAIR